MRASTRVARLALVGFLALSVVPAALADSAQEKALAQRYAPVVRLVADIEDCGPGYLPIDVNVLIELGAWSG